MSFALINPDNPTRVVIHWGWYLLTWGKFVVFLLPAVFIIGITAWPARVLPQPVVAMP